MPRYVAFLRGVSPMNAKMPELRQCFEAAGFSDVRTVLSSGNVVFTSRSTSEYTLERKAEEAMQAALGKAFGTFVRSVAYLQELIEPDPYSAFQLASNAKRVITFLRDTGPSDIGLPIEREGARILKVTNREVFTVYVPGAKGPVFMNLLERTFGSNITTRTLETVKKCAMA
ncbi:MAG TPA: DUF1697 domain-containing protein [Noviherbaspirillum sp.]|nr:DUF1697 domain-containing protein [Noviherbaspirillum sp.]